MPRYTPLNPARKSGHCVDSTDVNVPCWCGEVHYYADES
jgi:hypothetical protein